MYRLAGKSVNRRLEQKVPRYFDRDISDYSA
jgi:hypothetical protein